MPTPDIAMLMAAPWPDCASAICAMKSKKPSKVSTLCTDGSNFGLPSMGRCAVYISHTLFQAGDLLCPAFTILARSWPSL